MVNVHKGGFTPRVGKTGIIEKVFNFFSRKLGTRTRLTKKQDNTAIDPEVTDNGLACVTPCGQDGLYEGQYWCHTSDTSDTWDFCNPQYKGQFSKVRKI